MKRPQRSDDKYWIGSNNFLTLQWERDLNDYIQHLQNENHTLKKEIERLKESDVKKKFKESFRRNLNEN